MVCRDENMLYVSASKGFSSMLHSLLMVQIVQIYGVVCTDCYPKNNGYQVRTWLIYSRPYYTPSVRTSLFDRKNFTCQLSSAIHQGVCMLHACEGARREGK
jgi:F0F1-type ATP synthase membrane subunit c/vacuolar-type H+-ATPase subunit K